MLDDEETGGPCPIDPIAFVNGITYLSAIGCVAAFAYWGFL